VCNTRKLRGDPGTLGFTQHKTAVTICRNKQQHQVRVIAGNILLLWGGEVGASTSPVLQRHALLLVNPVRGVDW